MKHAAFNVGPVTIGGLHVNPGEFVTVYLHRASAPCGQCGHEHAPTPIQVELSVGEDGKPRVCCDEEEAVYTFAEVYPQAEEEEEMTNGKKKPARRAPRTAPALNEVTVTFKRAELRALRDAVLGDDFDVNIMNAALERIAAVEEEAGDG